MQRAYSSLIRAIYLGELLVNTAKKLPNAGPSTIVRVAGIAVRTLFLIALTIIAAHVASPQMEHIWSLYETPSDLIRVALGFAVCVWLVLNLFILNASVIG
jgi:succinate dehydrogenase hydrophobic anchor subunit